MMSYTFYVMPHQPVAFIYMYMYMYRCVCMSKVQYILPYYLIYTTHVLNTHPLLLIHTRVHHYLSIEFSPLSPPCMNEKVGMTTSEMMKASSTSHFDIDAKDQPKHVEYFFASDARFVHTYMYMYTHVHVHVHVHVYRYMYIYMYSELLIHNAHAGTCTCTCNRQTRYMYMYM